MFAARCALRWYPNGSATIRRSAVALLLRARTPWVGYEPHGMPHSRCQPLSALRCDAAAGCRAEQRCLRSSAARGTESSDCRKRASAYADGAVEPAALPTSLRANVEEDGANSTERSFRRRSCAGPGADVAGASPAVSPVPVQMWQGGAQSRCRCGRVGPRERVCNPRRAAQDIGRACAALMRKNLSGVPSEMHSGTA